MCSTFGLCILNSTCKGDLHGRYTYVTGLGCSVIDYFIASEELYYELLPISELTVAERTESSHLPVELVINTRQKNALGATNNNNGFKKKNCMEKWENRVLSTSCYISPDTRTNK